jgi:hypothetical protein
MNGKPSLAKSRFEEILEHHGHPDTVSYLRAMVNSTPPTVETECLDFKGATNPMTNTPIPENDVKKTWSEALAGFATTSGGVLIWGIDARKPSGATIDQACGLGFVGDPHAMKSRLQQLMHQATDPPVPGVVIEAFPDPSSGGQGFVVCYVPESDYKPHRTELGGKRWVMRIGDSFVDVPPSVLRSLFFPHRHSYISMYVTPRIEKEGVALDSRSVRAFLTIGFLNEGPATAVNFVAFEKSAPGKVMTRNAFWEVYPTRHGNQFGYVQPFHPGTRIEMWEMYFDIPKGLGATSVEGDIDVEYQISAHDQAPQVLRIHYPLLDLHDKIKKSAIPKPLEIARFQ